MLTTSQKTAIYKNIGRILRDARESLELTVSEAAAKQTFLKRPLTPMRTVRLSGWAPKPSAA
ncbi:MAG: hypothetical protein KHX55_02660 [Proteobacteria bacterium]|nr:hypothetical protein [Pseudomonadota bacterium]